MRKIIRTVHIRVVPSAAKSVSHYDDSMRSFLRGIQISRQFLSFIGNKLIFHALQSVKIINTPYKCLITFKTLIKILIIYYHR